MKKKLFRSLSAIILTFTMLFSLGIPAGAAPIITSGPLLLPHPTLLPVQPPVSQFSQEILEAPEAPQPPPTDMQQLRDAADKLASTLVTYGATSAQYAVMDGNEMVLSGTAGVYSMTENRQLTADNLYGIGSISKMYTTAAAMKLVEEGKLELDTPVVNYLPEFKMADERYVNITPRMLLNHSSGLYGSSMRNAMLFGDNDTFSHDNFLQTLQSQRLKAEPGEFSVYCNDGFTLMELIVEKISAKSFTDYLNDTFFAPMALKRTKTPQDDFDRSLLSKVYMGGSTQSLPDDTLNAIGAGGIYSTAEELCWFAQVLTGDRPNLLSAESTQAMMQPEYKNGIWPEGEDTSFCYGLGWDSVELYPFNRYGIQALAKGGDTRYYHSALVVLPQLGLSAAIVTSGGGSSLNTVAASTMLLNLLIVKGEITEPLPAQSFGEPVKVDMPQDIKRFTGLYHTGGQYIHIEISDEGVLTISYPDIPQMPTQVFSYTDGGGFVDPTGMAKLDFAEESNGKIYLSQHTYTTIPGLGQSALLQYVAEKLEPNPVSQQLTDIWSQRANKKYYPLGEKYTSQAFVSLIPTASLELSASVPGYISGLRITGENDAENAVQIPVMAGRDSTDISVSKADNGADLLQVRDGLYLSEEGLANLHGGDSSICTIQPTGFARWFTAADELAGRVMKVTIPQNASFAVFDGNGASITYSTVDQRDVVVLPQGAKIVFLGDAGARFEIQLLPAA